MGEQALGLVVKCLSFDFIGTNPDDSAEDVNTIQVPSAWRSVMQDTATMAILLEFYKNAEPPRSSSAMQALILLSSVRRSLFRSDKERSQFLGQVVLLRSHRASDASSAPLLLSPSFSFFPAAQQPASQNHLVTNAAGT